MPMCASQPWCHTKGGSASNIGVLFSQLRVKIVVPQVSEMSLLRCDVVLAGCKQVSGPRGQDEILLLKLHLIVVCMRISLRTSSSSYVRPDTWRIWGEMLLGDWRPW